MTSDNTSTPPSGDAQQRRPDPVGDLEAARRLLESPLLDGAESVPLAAVPEVKPLVWEHVVRPLDGTPAGGLPRIPPPAQVAEPAPTMPEVAVPAEEVPAPSIDPGAPRVAPAIDFAALRLGVADAVAGAGVRDDISLEAVVDERSKEHVTAEIDRLAFVPESPGAAPAVLPSAEAAGAPEGAEGAADGTSPADPAGDIFIVEATPTAPLATTGPSLPGVGPSLPPAAPTPVRPADQPAPEPSADAQRAAAPRRTYADLAASTRPAVRPRRKRRILSRLVTMLVLLGLVGVGLTAARQYLIEPQWADDIAPLADEIATVRGLEFTAAVPVVEQTPTVYSMLLAESVLDLSESVLDDTAGEWRALGLLNGVFDAAVLGRTALPDQPAFYDPATKTVNVVNGLGPELRTFALQRALTMALLDQHYAWSALITGEPLSVVTGTRMIVEADALATAQSLVTEAERTEIATQVTEQVDRLEVPPSPSPYATALLSRLGVAMWPWFRELPDSDRIALLTAVHFSDAQVLDLRRFAVVAPAAGSAPSTTIAGRPVAYPDEAPAGSRGMLFWYHVLASRVDSDLAWRAALSWQDDAVEVDRIAGKVCVSALFETDVAGSLSAKPAFEQWAATSPSPVTLVVTDRAVDPATGAATGLQISVQVCDAGPGSPASDGRSRLLLGGAPLRTEQFVRLLEANEGLVRVAAACLVYGPDPVAVSDERGVLDGLNGWAPPEAHPAIDPTAPCGAAAPAPAP
ncbi:MAG: hypothetical protein RLY45_2141 [Actinomycetota bacterium]